MEFELPLTDEEAKRMEEEAKRVLEEKKKAARKRANANRKARDDAMRSLGLTKVRGGWE